jgi:hypothetical protein
VGDVDDALRTALLSMDRVSIRWRRGGYAELEGVGTMGI